MAAEYVARLFRYERLAACALEFRPEPRHVRCAMIQEASKFTRFSPGKGVRGEQWKCDRGVDVAHHRIRQLVRIDLPPAHRLRRRRNGEPARIGPRLRDLQTAVVPLFLEAQ